MSFIYFIFFFVFYLSNSFHWGLRPFLHSFLYLGVLKSTGQVQHRLLSSIQELVQRAHSVPTGEGSAGKPGRERVRESPAGSTPYTELGLFCSLLNTETERKRTSFPRDIHLQSDMLSEDLESCLVHFVKTDQGLLCTLTIYLLVSLQCPQDSFIFVLFLYIFHYFMFSFLFLSSHHH